MAEATPAAVATPAAGTPAAVTPAAPPAAPAASPPQASTAQATAAPAATPAAAAEPAATPTPPVKEPAKVMDGLLAAKPADVDPNAVKTQDPAAPEPIKYDLKFPDGFTANDEAINNVTSIFQDAKVSPEIAQKLATFHATQLQEAGQKFADQQVEAWNTTLSGWQKEVMADPDIGGKNWPKVRNEIETGLQTFYGINASTPADAPARAQHKALVAQLAIGGADSNVHILKFIHKAVSRGAEGKPVQGNGPSAPRKSAADVMYPPKAVAAE